MRTRITSEQRHQIIQLLSQGYPRDKIATIVGVSSGQVAAIAAHITMGTYALDVNIRDVQARSDLEIGSSPVLDQAHRPVPNTDRPLLDQEGNDASKTIPPIPLGADSETGSVVYWNPDPANGSPNPHVLILGESGYGKTYATSCLLTELARREISSIVFDYGQGFSLESAPPAFVEFSRPVEVHVGRDGIDINPLQILSSDLRGPVNVAQRIADTFARVYPRIGVQQHAVLRQAVLDVMKDAGFEPAYETSWRNELPPFDNVREKLNTLAAARFGTNHRVAQAVASHISTVFVFDTFRSAGHRLDWSSMLRSAGRTYVLQLRGLEHSLEQAVTEFLLWNLIGYVESLGPGPMRCFIVLDEAHRLSFAKGSPAEKLLREGRKFGLGLILASQQPEDFTATAFANTATKLVFQISDERSSVSRQLHRKARNAQSAATISQIITKLPRGWAYTMTENVGQIVHLFSFDERVTRWQQ